MEIVPSENIIALRRLSEKLSQASDTENYQNLIKEIKNVVEEISLEIGSKSTSKEKVKCYDKMCVTITNLLEKLN
jgi:hypothetical protein